MCYNVDPVELASLFSFRIEYVNITWDGSILGQTSSGSIWTTSVGTDMNDMCFFTDGKMILIEKRLLQSPKSTGCKNFTIAHEVAHQFINREFPQMYGSQYRTFCDYRRSVKPHAKITDWYKWQADALAATILLPKDALHDSMFMFGLGEKMKLLSRKYSQTKYQRFCEILI